MQSTSRQSSSPLDADGRAPMFLRLPMVVHMTGLCRSTIYKMVSEKKFPSPVRLGDRAVAWRQSDLAKWSESRLPSFH